MRRMLLVGAVTCLVHAAISAEPAVTFTAKPVVKKNGAATTVDFSVSARADVEVAILDATGAVVRHLAAGVLDAENLPPPPLKPGLSQSVEWDGKDDYGNEAKGGPFQARVRTGMGAKLDKILGGDPYAFFSSEIVHGNHSLWTVAGIDAKADGSVYVFGTAGQQGPFTVRQYDADGNYIRTVFPFPSGMPEEKIRGWGINRLDDGSCVPVLPKGVSSWPCYSSTAINVGGGFGPQPVLLPTTAPDTLTIAGASRLELLTFRTDGSIDPDPKVHTARHLVQNPALISLTGWDDCTQARGGIFTCPTPDGKSFYLSGVSRIDGKDPFWRPGQVWKVDYATRTATPWFALPDEQVDRFNIKGHRSYSPLQGVAADGAGHVFVCDRLNNRVSVLTDDAKPVRDLNVANPDDVAWDAEAKALYVTTRFGRQGAPGDVQLLRFDDWKKDDKPSLQMKLCVNDIVLSLRERSYIRIVGAGAKKRIWIGYKDLPVRIYREKGKELELVKDFYQSGQKLRYLAFRSMVADPVTGTLYFASGCGDIWKLRDWEKGEFRQCRDAADQPREDSRGCSHPRQILAAEVAIDSRNRYLFTRQNNNERVYRWALDGEDHVRAPVGKTGSPIFSDRLVMNEYPVCLYFDRGMWPSPDGGMLVLGGATHYMDVHLFYHPIDPTNGPGKCESLLKSGDMCGGLRVDRQGRIYLGIRLPENPPKPPAGFKDDWAYGRLMGRIAVYEPTGTGTRLYPTPLKGSSKVYDVHYGLISRDSSQIGFSPRFGVDDYGRICYPNTLTRSVAIMDNAGNEILRFGTYGNIDDWRALEGRWGEAKSIPLSWPGAVDATDGWIYVADHANIGVLRLRKTWAAAETVGMP